MLKQTQKVFFHKYLNFNTILRDDDDDKVLNPPGHHFNPPSRHSRPNLNFFSAHFFHSLKHSQKIFLHFSFYPTHVTGKHSLRRKKCNNNNLLAEGEKEEKRNSLNKEKTTSTTLQAKRKIPLGGMSWGRVVGELGGRVFAHSKILEF